MKSFLSDALIEKLPESWSEFQNKLNHEAKDYTREQLVNSIKIEETILQRNMSITFPPNLKLMLLKLVAGQKLVVKIRTKRTSNPTTITIDSRTKKFRKNERVEDALSVGNKDIMQLISITAKEFQIRILGSQVRKNLEIKPICWRMQK